MNRRRALLVVLLLAGIASAAPAELAVEARVTGVDLDDSMPPVLAVVEVEIVNRSDATIQQCEVELRFLDAAGKVVMRRAHTATALELAPGKDTVTNFEDSDPPKSWSRAVELTVRCSG